MIESADGNASGVTPPVRIFALAAVRASDLKRAGRSPSSGISKYVMNEAEMRVRVARVSQARVTRTHDVADDLDAPVVVDDRAH